MYWLILRNFRRNAKNDLFSVWRFHLFSGFYSLWLGSIASGNFNMCFVCRLCGLMLQSRADGDGFWLNINPLCFRSDPKHSRCWFGMTEWKKKKPDCSSRFDVAFEMHMFCWNIGADFDSGFIRARPFCYNVACKCGYGKFICCGKSICRVWLV